MSDEQKYIDFEAYERVAEPHKRERVSAWRTAIGLQDVDGLRVSDYLKEIAVRHIEGDITIDEVREQLIPGTSVMPLYVPIIVIPRKAYSQTSLSS